MCTKSPGAPQRCRLILQHCLAIQLSKPGDTLDDFWMYDSGYMIFQNFLAANAQCWWNGPLTAATRVLKYAGHVAPGLLLVTAEPCALEVLRSAYARSILKPPATYTISSVGDIDDCVVTPTAQGQFTPLLEALCDVIMDLTSQGQSATIENMRVKLSIKFPHMQYPTTEIIYDTLAQLMQERKIYQTAKGYFIVTPERRRSRSKLRAHRTYNDEYDVESTESRIMLMTNAEALHNLYGEILTERDGDRTHQCIQTNLADVICGGNPNDRILYARSSKRRSASFPTPRSLERRHSLRFFGGSSKKLQRCSSTRSLSKNYTQQTTTICTDSSSSEYHSTDSSSPIKKVSLLSRLFRRSGRSKQRQIEKFSAQFPPPEWFNSKAVHLHNVGTQTSDHDIPVAHSLSNSIFYDGSEISQRSSTLPRRHKRHVSSESTFVISSRDCSPIRRQSPAYCTSSLPRSTHSIPPAPPPAATAASIKKTNGCSTQRVQRTIPSKHLNNEQNRLAAGYPRNHLSNSSTLDNKFMNDREKYSKYIQNNNSNSGPSSLESNKLLCQTPEPTSLESEKLSSILNGSSGGGGGGGGGVLSSLDSTNSSMSTSITPTRSSKIKLSKSKLATDSINRIKCTNNNLPSVSSTFGRNKLDDINNNNQNTQQKYSKSSDISNSTSNNSITLQVTTTTNSNFNNSTTTDGNLPSTKIYVQNSPVRSIITLENNKLNENSNVLIINNETTSNDAGELIKRTISKYDNPVKIERETGHHEYIINNNNNINKHKDNHSIIDVNRSNNSTWCDTLSENDGTSETTNDDSLSLIIETSPETSLSNHPALSNTYEVLDNLKFKKNINNDTTMNNSRKLQQLHTTPMVSSTSTTTSSSSSSCNNRIYKNILKDATSTGDSNPTSPIYNNENYFETKNIQQLVQQQQHQQTSDKSYQPYHQCGGGAGGGSVGNLRFFEKNTKKIISNCDLNNIINDNNNELLYGNLSKLNSNPAISTTTAAADSLVNILHKNIVAVGSEPNLAIKNLDYSNQKLNSDKKTIEKEIIERQISNIASTDNNPGTTIDLYNFPSLTDLSFNFTSLAAQKILQGVSRNSIDTLVELNMVQEKQLQQQQQQQQQKSNGTASTNNTMSGICTDYGMI